MGNLPHGARWNPGANGMRVPAARLANSLSWLRRVTVTLNHNHIQHLSVPSGWSMYSWKKKQSGDMDSAKAGFGFACVTSTSTQQPAQVLVASCCRFSRRTCSWSLALVPKQGIFQRCLQCAAKPTWFGRDNYLCRHFGSASILPKQLFECDFTQCIVCFPCATKTCRQHGSISLHYVSPLSPNSATSTLKSSFS